jgi:endonuclease III
MLDRFFPTVTFPLYYKTPFSFLISVMLSANTTDKQANAAAKKLYLLADDADKMKDLPQKKIERAIYCCGLYKKKAKNILSTSKIISKKYHGEVPNSFDQLMSLPGVGRKTANVVLLNLFHIDAFPVDTHIFRLAKRWKITSKNNILQAEKDIKKKFPKKHWGKIHLQMIYFGRKYCTAKAHKEEKCPICSMLKKTV